VGEHAALRRTDRTRGVDQRRDVVGIDFGQALRHRLRRHLRPKAAQLVDRDRPFGGPAEEHDVLEPRAALADPFDLRRLRGVLAEDQLRLGMTQYVFALLRRVGVVDGCDDRARTGRAAIGERPVGRGQAEDRHAIAGLDAEADEAPGDLTADRAELGVGDVGRLTVTLELKRDAGISGG
jgi:hypothetical protein